MRNGETSEAARSRVGFGVAPSGVESAHPDARPRHRGSVRWAVPMPVAVAAGVILALLVGLVVVRQLGRVPGEPIVLSSTDDSSSVDEQAPSGLIDLTEPARTLVVHVVGQVQNPGLVELPDGSRVADAITAAGGATDQADLAALNLARLLGDGEQILVPIPGETVPQAGAASSGLLDLNTADESALEELPGIGPVLAGRIVAWRQQHGRFSSVDELVEVAGIGPAILAQIRDLVRV